MQSIGEARSYLPPSMNKQLYLLLVVRYAFEPFCTFGNWRKENVVI